MGVVTGSATIRELELWGGYWVSHYKRAGIVAVVTGSATIRELELWVGLLGQTI